MARQPGTALPLPCHVSYCRAVRLWGQHCDPGHGLTCQGKAPAQLCCQTQQVMANSLMVFRLYVMLKLMS